MSRQTVVEQQVRWLVVSDLDGTMLNHHSYDVQAAIDAIRTLQEKNIPVILNTSKTYNETISIRKTLGIEDAFIVENGSCLYLPKSSFDKPVSAAERDDYWEVLLGTLHQEIERVLDSTGLAEDDAIRLSRCGVQQTVDLTGLSAAQSEQAIAREFSEPLIWKSDESSLSAFKQQLRQNGLTTLQGGRFLHVIGDCDKGKATTTLVGCYSDIVKTIALGDSANDAAMLLVADISIIVNSPSNDQLCKLVSADMRTTQAAPEGWREAIEKSLQYI